MTDPHSSFTGTVFQSHTLATTVLVIVKIRATSSNTWGQKRSHHRANTGLKQITSCPLNWFSYPIRYFPGNVQKLQHEKKKYLCK